MLTPRAHPGVLQEEIDTPALLLDAEVMEGNLHRMADFLAGKGINLRPHVKLYRATPELAHLQLQAGAIGLTCAKLSEAEALAASGISDILIANQIVSPLKIRRLCKLAETIDIKVAVDGYTNVAALSQAARTAGVTLGILVEVNIGHNRCGVAPFASALELAQFICKQPGLHYLGLMGYDGHCTSKVAESDRADLSRKANQLLADTSKYIEAAGIENQIVSGSGTYTYRFAAEVGGLTEIQAGTYLLMDTAFQEHGVREFDCALSVLATVTSRPSYPGADNLAIIDMGRKTLGTMLGIPEVIYPEQARILSLSDEHGRVTLEGEALALQVGDRIEIGMRDANGTINQFDRFHVIRKDKVEAVWTIPLCGRST